MDFDSRQQNEVLGMLVTLRERRQVYLAWRDLYVAIMDDGVLSLSPNFDVLVSCLVIEGKKSLERYQSALLDCFTGLPLDQWEEVGK